MFEFAWKEIIRRKARSIANIIGFALGVIIFSVLISLLKVSEQGITQVLTNTGTHFIAYQTLCCGLPFVSDDALNKNFVANGISTQPMPILLIDSIKTIPEDQTPSATAFLMTCQVSLP